MRSVFSVEWLAQSSHSSTPPTMTSHCHHSPASFWEPCDPEPPATRNQNQNQSYQQQQQGTESSFSPAEDTSDYDSEERPSACPSVRGSPRPPGGRRSRTAFTAEQISCLEATFKKNAYLGTQDKTDLCRKLQLTDKQVRNWFQNRRMKMKRCVQDALTHVCQAPPFLTYSYGGSGFLPPSPFGHAHSLQLPSLHTDQYSHYSQYYQYGAVMPPTTTTHYYPPYY